MRIARKEVLLFKENYAIAHIVQYSPIYWLNGIIFSVIITFFSILVMFRCFTIVNTVFFPAHAVQLFFIPGLFLITTHPVIAYFLNIHHFEFLGPQRLYFLRG